MQSLDMAWKLLEGLRSLPDVARERKVVAYEVTGPQTVYIRASHCRVLVHRTTENQIQVEGDLRQAFGWEWVTDRDDAGVYVVLKRRPIVGRLSSADLILSVPADAYLVFNLTPGSVHLHDFQGRLSVAPMQDSLITSEPVAEPPSDEEVPSK